MSTQNTGGPAFPCEYVEQASGVVGNNVPIMAMAEGLTVLDYFAAKAMQELIHMIYGEKFKAKNDKPITEEVIAKQAYHFADAMLAERSK